MKRISVGISGTDLDILRELQGTEPGKGRHAWELASKTGRNVHTVISALAKLERLGILISRRGKNDRNVPRVLYDLTGPIRAYLGPNLSQGLHIIHSAIALKRLYPRANMKEALAAGYLAFRRLNHGSALQFGPDNLKEIRDELVSFRDDLDLTIRVMPSEKDFVGTAITIGPLPVRKISHGLAQVRMKEAEGTMKRTRARQGVAR